ncbi:MAG: hypothetical protein ACREXY_17420, partial [Gammaproteobacteria bacterium]
ADGLVELNLLLGTWANLRLMVHGTRRSTYTLTSSLSPHTIGSGGTFNTTRPLRIDGAGVLAAGSTTGETPLKILTDAEYREIPDKASTSSVPNSVWVEWAHPLAKLWLYPVPTTGATLALYAWSRITEFASSDTVTLPDGYENALAHSLALQWAPLFGVEPSGTLVNNAAVAIEAIRRTNAQVPLASVDPAISGSGGFSLVTGDT